MSKNYVSDMSDKGGRRKKRTRRPMALADWFGLACAILLVACSVILYIQLLATNMVPDKLLVLLAAVLLVINALHLVAQLPRWRNKLIKLVCGVLSLVICAGMIYGISAMDSVQSTLLNITGEMSEQDVSYVVVLKDNPAETISDTEEYQFGILSQGDATNTSALMDAIAEGLNITPATTSFDAITDLVDALYAQEVDTIVLNEGYISLMENMDEYADFSQRTRIIYEFTTLREVEPIEPNPAITKEPFVVYCSGIDSRYTDVNITSLSDVNILAVVNPETHQILLINTPRDYYVPMVSEPYAGMRDKLTHAGMIGVEESMKVLSNLYDVEAKYYIRVNFLGLKDIVDALGGIEVVSPEAFTTVPMYIIPTVSTRSYSFDAGPITLSGIEAVAFSRERKAFEDGDVQRGKNQMTVIKGIVNKATSPQILKSYDEVLKAVEGHFLTNMPYEDISALVRMQLRDMSGWNITSYTVSGYADYQPCASYGSTPLWVMWPEEADMSTAQTLIQQVLNGEVPTPPAKD